MENQTPTPAALREAAAIRIREISQAMNPSDDDWESLGDNVREIWLAQADTVLALRPLDPGEAPAPAQGDYACEMVEECEPNAPNIWRVFRHSDPSIEATVCTLDSGEQDNEAMAKLIAAGLNAGTPSPQGLGEARTPREVRGLAADFASAINCRSLENESNTPDFILGEFLVSTLNALNAAINRREAWYGRQTSPAETAASPSPAPAPKGEAEAPTLHDMGYEPGDYFNHCHRCKAGFLGDKRAFTCHSCAAEMRGEKMLEARQSPQGSVSEANRPNPNRNPDVTPSAAPQGQEESK